MKKTFRLVSLMLALLMALSVLIGCSDKEEEGKSTGSNAEEVNTDLYDPGLPAADFGGYTFTFAGRGKEGNLSTYDASDLVTEADGEAVNEAIYKRNVEICNRYNFNLDIVYIGNCSGKLSGSEFYRAVETAVMTNDGTYDAVVGAAQDTVGLSMQSLTLNLYDVENLDLTQQWWDQSVARDLAVGSKIYMATGDIMTGDKRGILSTVFNKTLSAQLGLPNHYDLVKEGKWTLETFYANSIAATDDKSGNGQMGEKEDQYGYLYWESAMQSFISGTGNAIGRVVYGGMFELGVEDETMINMWDSVIKFLKTDSVYTAKDHAGEFPDYTDATKYMFESNKCLYAYTTVAGIARMRSYNADIGILPNPKANESQQDYITGVLPWSVNFIAIPSTCSDTSRAGHILEALAAKGLELIRPAYYDITLSTKAASDLDSSAMLDILFETRAYDIGSFMEWGKLPEAMMAAFNAKDENLTSTIAGVKKNAKADMDAQMVLLGLK